MVDLKNEALRERHWREILRETTVDIDLTNNILTLENIFQMEYTMTLILSTVILLFLKIFTRIGI